MSISRRSLLLRLGATAVAGAAVQPLGDLSFAQVPEPSEGVSRPPHRIFLDRNENAYGPSENVLTVLREASSSSNRYPRTEYEVLLAKIAALHAVTPEQIVLGCGSSEILRLAATALLAPGKRLVQAVPTCPLLGRFARSAAMEVIDVPINKRHQHDLDAMLARAGHSAALVYICNPNNPTASLTPRKDIENFIRKLPAKATVLIDEAYHHFVIPNSEYASFLDHPVDDPRIIVCRTFSKIYGLAGLRVGYAVTSTNLARRLSAQRLPFGISVIAAKAAAAALEDSEYIRLSAKRNADDRQEFMNRVNIGMLRAIDSHTNFVMMDAMRPPDQVIEHLEKNNIVIGPPIPLMDKYVRVSLGTPGDMQEFWRVWDQMPSTGKMAM
jgi:histidinol-phosphate aminotransferase